LYAVLLLAGSAAAESFSPPALVSENREGPLAPFALYAPLALAAPSDGGSGVLIWLESRFGASPFEFDLLGKRLDPEAVGPDQYLGPVAERLPAEGPAVRIEAGGRVHLVYGTRVQGESRLVHRLTDLSLASGAEQVLDRAFEWLGLPAVVPGPGGRLAVVYRRGFDLYYQEAPVREPPLLLVRDARPVAFAAAAAGGSVLVAYASAKREGLPDQLGSRIELIEVAGGSVAARSVLADLAAPVSGLDLAASEQGRVALAWSDDRFSVPQLLNTEIYCRLREPDGRWGPEQRLSHTLAESYAPSLVWDAAGRLHVFWQDSAFGAYEIFHRTAEQERGVDVVSAQDGAQSVTPRAVLLGGRVVVVWRDAVEGRADLYLSRSEGPGP
jgi:hypothetical protein